MKEIDKSAVEIAIASFLTDQLNKKLEPETKKLQKAKESNDDEKITEITIAIDKLRNKYTLDNWMSDAANRMASQLKFGTHISKGVHPDSKGDNVNFQHAAALPDGLIGSQTLKKLALDANGNAAALPLAAFFNTSVGNSGDIKLRDLIQNEHPALSGVFASNPSQSNQYANLFKAALNNPLTQPNTHERNKQLLWPRTETANKSDDYICLVPLYPSALTHALYHSINGLRYSEANKQARDNRKKKTAEQQPYLSINNLASTTLGGSNSQNVSLLTGSKSGRNHLLPSLPPKMSQEKDFSINQRQTSLFNNNLHYRCRFVLKELFSIVEADKSTWDIRDRRKQTLDMILFEILSIAASIQNKQPPGWSKDSQLDMAEKYWLDPRRAELEDEEAFIKQKAATDWVKEIEQRFASWLNSILKKQFPKQRLDFNDAEYNEWLKEMRQAIKASQRTKQGVFA